MPRYLTMQRSIVPSPERAGFLSRLAERRTHFEKQGCRAWSFEEVGLPGAIMEFVESADQSQLVRALAAAPGSGGENARIYKELE